MRIAAGRDPAASDIEGRYHVIGIFADGEHDMTLCSAERCKTDAFAAARRAVGPRRYDDARIYDSKARHGAPQVWAADGTVLERRP